MMNPRGLARAHGVFNVAGGAWPLLHRRSFECVFGPKADEWLQYTVGGLLVASGLSQIRASRTPEGVRHAARTGVGTAAVLLAVDLVYVPRGRIAPTYLLDALMEAGWLMAWYKCGRVPAEDSGGH